MPTHSASIQNAVSSPRVLEAVTGRVAATTIIPAFSKARRYGFRYFSNTFQITGGHGLSHTTTDSSTASVAWELPLLPGQRKPRDANIVRDSLQETIEAHREANLAKQIRKYKSASSPQIAETTVPFEQNVHQIFRELGLAIPSEIDCLDDTERLPHVIRRTGDQLERLEILKLKSPLDVVRQLDRSCNAHERLNCEIKALEDYLQPTRTERDAVAHCVQQTARLTTQTFPDLDFELHGSRMTGLHRPLSGIDFFYQTAKARKISGSKGVVSKNKVRKLEARVMGQLERVLRNNPNYSRIQTFQSRTPCVLEALDNHTNLTLHFMHKPASNREDLSQYFQAEYYHLKPLHLLLSQCLDNRGFLDGKDGGVTSYGLLVMIVTALGHSKMQYRKDELGKSLLQVLKFWAEADLLQYGYCPEPPRTFRKYSRTIANGTTEATEYNNDIVAEGLRLLVKHNMTELRGAVARYQLCLQDPAHPTNDLGSRAERALDIQKFFSQALKSILGEMGVWDSLTYQERQQGDVKIILLKNLTGTNWRKLMEGRHRLQSSSPSWL